MILDQFSLEGKCGLVTGSGSGIGKGMAAELAEAGAKVALAARNMDKLSKSWLTCIIKPIYFELIRKNFGMQRYSF